MLSATLGRTWHKIALIIGLLILACGDPAPSTERSSGYQLPPTVVANGLPIFNVQNYGAIGNGVADDRAAITNAIAAACSSSAPAIVFFPAGTYSVSRDGSHSYSLNLTCSHITLQGVPFKSSIMQPSGMPNTPVTILQITSVNHIVITDLIIDGNWQNAVSKIACPVVGSACSDNAALPQSTIYVDDESFFPSGGGPFTVMTRNDTQAYVSCTGKATATVSSVLVHKLTGCTGGTGTLYAGMTIGYVDAPSGINQATQSSAVSTIAIASNGATLPQATINLASTTGFSNATEFELVQTSQGYQQITCTGAANAQLTGCTGGTGTLSTGGEVFQGNLTQGRNPGIGLSSASEIEIRDVVIQRIYGDCIDMGGGITPTSNTRITRVDCNISSRDGIAISSNIRGLTIDSFRAFSIAAQAIDGEPVAWPDRDVTIENSRLEGWWNVVTHSSVPVSIAGGDNIQSTDASNWRVHNTTMLGSVIIGGARNVVFDSNWIVQNYANDDSSAVEIIGWNRDVTISNNVIETRSATSGIEGQADCCGILVSSFVYAGGAITTPVNVNIFNNHVRVQNGRYGIVVVGSGQAITNASGACASGCSLGTTVVSGITYGTFADTGAAWTTNQWIGAIIRIGNVEASVKSNTATVLTLHHVVSVNTNNRAWFTADTYDQTDDPAIAAYKITFPTGVIDVHHNFVDAHDEGYGKGSYCYVIGSGNTNSVTMRARMRDNQALDCDGDAYHLHFNITNPFPYLEVVDNFAHDDQGTPTTTNLIGFTNAIKATKILIRGNVKGEGVTNAMGGISGGQWLVNDGVVQEWAGYGAPETVVSAPVGSRYHRVNGTTGQTVDYLKGSGSGNTGWVTAAPIDSKDHLQTTGAAPALTSCGTGPSIVGDDVSGTITEGTIATGCVMTFAQAYPAGPPCIFYSESNLGFTVSKTASAITITNVGALSGTAIDYVCARGH